MSTSGDRVSATLYVDDKLDRYISDKPIRLLVHGLYPDWPGVVCEVTIRDGQIRLAAVANNKVIASTVVDPPEIKETLPDENLEGIDAGTRILIRCHALPPLGGNSPGAISEMFQEMRNLFNRMFHPLDTLEDFHVDAKDGGYVILRTSIRRAILIFHVNERDLEKSVFEEAPGILNKRRDAVTMSLVKARVAQIFADVQATHATIVGVDAGADVQTSSQK